MNKDHVLVYGESPASNQGTDTWHWIAKDLSPFAGEVGEGGKTLGLHSGTVRTKDAADTLAASKYGAIKDNSAWGRLKIMGNPKVKPGDAIEIKNVEKPGLNGLFKVTCVSHVLNKQNGYLTYVGFTGSGGADEASGLLGAQAGASGF
jgi:phage protein D